MSDENETRDRQPEGRRPAWRSGAPSGQERVVSYESDERYWTDYLRVALPVVGLLLMLGLLVWWANSIIGDEQGNQPPTSTVASNTQVALASTNTPVPTVEGGLTPTEVVTSNPTPGNSDGAGGDATETPDGDDPTTEPADCDGDFKRGDAVVVTDDDVNLRQSADVTSDALDQLAAGTALTIISDCYTEGPDGTLFWRVSVDDEDAMRGYISAAFLEPAE